MNFIFKNWKTSLAGLIMLTPTLLSLIGVVIPPDVTTAIHTLAVAGGLFAAKDGNVSGTGKTPPASPIG